ncbi:hypothetical protein MKW94_022506 [Papaver nudicaule]|uniref:Uncharacterized protein n=1 Tax=Papaver nudicaule TaxID=74823 RepID=A0AA41VZ19_PAPNU|nr:hypothetical protein [Papaver nudicaule]
MTEMHSNTETNIRCAVVTGGNKGIGFEICRQLASKGISVVLTSRDVTKGLGAVEKLKNSFGLSNVVFHQLDVMNPITLPPLADFIRTQFGKLDILVSRMQPLVNFLFHLIACLLNFSFQYLKVNNAGITGVITDAAGFTALGQALVENDQKANLKQMIKETYELAEECMQTNYYGVKSVTKALIPLLQLSGSPRIVNVSSSIGELKNVSNEKALKILSDGDGLKEKSVDEIVNMFLKDFKEDLLESNGWPANLPAYTISKACLNAYTRILAKKYPIFRINCLCPGYVNSNFNCNTGVITTAQGAERVVNLALVPDDGPSGLYFTNGEVSPY